jgi:hypothetical protein
LRLLAAALLLLSACQASEPSASTRTEAELSPVRMAFQDGLGLLDCSRAAVPLQPGYAEEERRYRALVGRAEKAGLGPQLERWRRDYRAAMAVADMACSPQTLADDLRKVNDRLDTALKEQG